MLEPDLSVVPHPVFNSMYRYSVVLFITVLFLSLFNAVHAQEWAGEFGFGTDGTLRALAQGPDGEVYVGGDFERAGTLAVRGIARWTGEEWESIGSLDGDVRTLQVDGGTPGTFELAQNYPNPFNPATVIAFSLAEPTLVRLEVFDLLGRRVAVLADEGMAAGTHRVTFDAGDLASCMYVYRLEAGDFVASRRMLLAK
jgi:hypothetical protein